MGFPNSGLETNYSTMHRGHAYYRLLLWLWRPKSDQRSRCIDQWSNNNCPQRHLIAIVSRSWTLAFCVRVSNLLSIWWWARYCTMVGYWSMWACCTCSQSFCGETTPLEMYIRGSSKSIKQSQLYTNLLQLCMLTVPSHIPVQQLETPTLWDTYPVRHLPCETPSLWDYL